jgi:hypothetical protein
VWRVKCSSMVRTVAFVSSRSQEGMCDAIKEMTGREGLDRR